MKEAPARAGKYALVEFRSGDRVYHQWAEVYTSSDPVPKALMYMLRKVREGGQMHAIRDLFWPSWNAIQAGRRGEDSPLRAQVAKVVDESEYDGPSRPWRHPREVPLEEDGCDPVRVGAVLREMYPDLLQESGRRAQRQKGLFD